jgi:hypothetical protein
MGPMPKSVFSANEQPEPFQACQNGTASALICRSELPGFVFTGTFSKSNCVGLKWLGSERQSEPL